MYRLTVLYGHPDNPEAFDRYYQETHIPIAKKMKGLRGWTVGKCEAVEKGQRAPYYMIVGLYTETREDMDAILETPEGRATVADVPKFATGGVTFVYDNERVMIPYALG